MKEQLSNKMSMYLALREWIDAGIAEAIYDSPFQCSEYAPYVVTQLLKNTPKKHIPGAVLDEIEKELIAQNKVIPKRISWFKRLLAR